jgi:hypothetical protein
MSSEASLPILVIPIHGLLVKYEKEVGERFTMWFGYGIAFP